VGTASSAPHPVGTASSPMAPLASMPPGTSSSAAPSPTTMVGGNTSTDSVTGGGSAILLTQMNQLGPSERCTASQAQSMGQQLLGIMAHSKRTKNPLPCELRNSTYLIFYWNKFEVMQKNELNGTTLDGC
jgi:hypothetical protein